MLYELTHRQNSTTNCYDVRVPLVKTDQNALFAITRQESL